MHLVSGHFWSRLEQLRQSTGEREQIYSRLKKHFNRFDLWSKIEAKEMLLKELRNESKMCIQQLFNILDKCPNYENINPHTGEFGFNLFSFKDGMRQQKLLMKEIHELKMDEMCSELIFD